MNILIGIESKNLVFTCFNTFLFYNFIVTEINLLFYFDCCLISKYLHYIDYFHILQFFETSLFPHLSYGRTPHRIFSPWVRRVFSHPFTSSPNIGLFLNFPLHSFYQWPPILFSPLLSFLAFPSSTTHTLHLLSHFNMVYYMHTLNFRVRELFIFLISSLL
jgi:hypothetical protein